MPNTHRCAVCHGVGYQGQRLDCANPACPNKPAVCHGVVPTAARMLDGPFRVDGVTAIANVHGLHILREGVGLGVGADAVLKRVALCLNALDGVSDGSLAAALDGCEDDNDRLENVAVQIDHALRYL